MIGLLLVLYLPYLMHSFNITCPSAGQWLLRASNICLFTDQYTCLSDFYNQIYNESCRGPIAALPGERRVINNKNLDIKPCTFKRYQPVTFSSTQGSACLVQKGKCSDEGLVIYRNGTSEMDRTCRCDYTRGFAFTSTDRTDPCSCKASTEDCSCYKKECNKSQVLSPDYLCMEQNKPIHSVCEEIKENMNLNKSPIQSFGNDSTGLINGLQVKRNCGLLCRSIYTAITLFYVILWCVLFYNRDKQVKWSISDNTSRSQNVDNSGPDKKIDESTSVPTAVSISVDPSWEKNGSNGHLNDIGKGDESVDPSWEKVGSNGHLKDIGKEDESGILKVSLNKDKQVDGFFLSQSNRCIQQAVYSGVDTTSTTSVESKSENGETTQKEQNSSSVSRSFFSSPAPRPISAGRCLAKPAESTVTTEIFRQKTSTAATSLVGQKPEIGLFGDQTTKSGALFGQYSNASSISVPFGLNTTTATSSAVGQTATAISKDALIKKSSTAPPHNTNSNSLLGQTIKSSSGGSAGSSFKQKSDTRVGKEVFCPTASSAESSVIGQCAPSERLVLWQTSTFGQQIAAQACSKTSFGHIAFRHTSSPPSSQIVASSCNDGDISSGSRLWGNTGQPSREGTITDVLGSTIVSISGNETTLANRFSLSQSNSCMQQVVNRGVDTPSTIPEEIRSTKRETAQKEQTSSSTSRSIFGSPTPGDTLPVLNQEAYSEASAISSTWTKAFRTSSSHKSGVFWSTKSQGVTCPDFLFDTKTTRDGQIQTNSSTSSEAVDDSDTCIYDSNLINTSKDKSEETITNLPAVILKSSEASVAVTSNSRVGLLGQTGTPTSTKLFGQISLLAKPAESNIKPEILGQTTLIGGTSLVGQKTEIKYFGQTTTSGALIEQYSSASSVTVSKDMQKLSTALTCLYGNTPLNTNSECLSGQTTKSSPGDSFGQPTSIPMVFYRRHISSSESSQFNKRTTTSCTDGSKLKGLCFSDLGRQHIASRVNPSEIGSTSFGYSTTSSSIFLSENTSSNVFSMSQQNTFIPPSDSSGVNTTPPRSKEMGSKNGETIQKEQPSSSVSGNSSLYPAFNTSYVFDQSTSSESFKTSAGGTGLYDTSFSSDTVSLNENITEDGCAFSHSISCTPRAVISGVVRTRMTSNFTELKKGTQHKRNRQAFNLL